MKSLYSILLLILVYVPVSAQKATLRFDGSTNANNSTVRNYMVDIDGKRYYSTDANTATNNNVRTVDINDLGLGSHKILVYELDNNFANTANTSDPIYSNNFQLRSGYDMVIGIRRNGQVSFSERRTNLNTVASANTPMTQTEFDKQLQSVKSKWSQTSKYNAIKSALASKSNYFTTDQVGQLLMLISSESRRLELAKLSYPRVTDPNNFGDVTDLFTTQANKDNITGFIQSKNPQYTNNTTAIDNSRPPISTQQFNQLQRQIRNQYEESGKVAVLRDALNTSSNYFTTAQLKQLLLLIQNENDRLVLAKQSYARVSDQTNFSSLSTVFNTQANRDDFNNYIRYGETQASTQYSSSRTPMSDGDFSKLQLKARLHFHQSSIVSDIKTAFSNTNDYFTVDQIRSLLSMVKSESDRLMLAKLAYLRVVDPTTFTQLYDMFSSQTSIDELNNYIKATALR